MSRISTTLMVFFLLFAVSNCGQNRDSHASKNQPRKQTNRNDMTVPAKIPKPPVKYTIMENFSMSRGDFGIKVRAEKNLTKVQVMALAKHFQSFGIKSANGTNLRLTFDGGLRMIHIVVPFPKGTKAKSQDVYVLKNDIRHTWF